MKFDSNVKMSERPSHVVGPCGEMLTIDALPSGKAVRWTVRRKAEVVSAVRGGLLTFDEACTSYGLAMEELISWQGALERSGMPGLRVTRTQEYRERYRY
jgi:hypothetical protein